MQLRLRRDFLFVDDAALRTHSRWPAAAVEQLFAKAFGNQPAGDPSNGTKCWQPPSVCITDYELGAPHELACLVSTISNTRSLNTESNKRIGKAASTLSRLLLYGTGFREEANGKTPAGLLRHLQLEPQALAFSNTWEGSRGPATQGQDGAAGRGKEMQEEDTTTRRKSCLGVMGLLLPCSHQNIKGILP